MSIFAATGEALALLAGGDPGLWSTIATTLAVAGAALALALPAAVLLAYVLAAGRFAGRRAALLVLHALLGVPTVVVGLALYLLLSSQGPLGAFDLLFTPAAVALGQFVIALPILTAFCHASFEPDLQPLREHARALGLGRLRTALLAVREKRRGLASSAFAGFGRIVSEVGCALLVGGNIAGSTRTIPTAIALETGKGQFVEGIALGIVLLLLAACASLAFFWLTGGGKGGDGR